MDGMHEPRLIDLPVPGAPVSEEEIERARKAIMEAPTTESGIVLPPHVQQARMAQIDEAAAPKLNREQRRRQEKAERKRAKQARKMNPRQVEALQRVEEATKHLSEDQLVHASALVRQLGAMSPEEREEYRRKLEADDAA